MAKFRLSKKKTGIVATVLVVVLLLGAVGGLLAIFNNESKTIPASAFSVGGLDEYGKPNYSKTSIYTKDAFACEGLRIVPDFEADLTYDVYYYDANGNLLDKKTGLEESFEQDYPLADTCRVVIHPAVPDGVRKGEWEIRFFEVVSYAKKLTIVVDKEQTVYTSSPNLYNAEMVAEGTFEATDVKTIVPNASLKSSALISVDTDKYDYYRIYVKHKGLSDVATIVAFADEDGKAIYLDKDAEVAEGMAYTFDSNDMLADTWYSVILEVPEDAVSLRVSAPNDAEVRIYGITEE